MASVSQQFTSPADRERQFFLIMSLAIAAAVVGGFGIRLVLGVTDFGMPWWVHVHAVSYMAWTGFYVLQNYLVVRGDVALHRRLGRMGGWAAIWICFVGFGMTYQTLAAGRVLKFFEPAYFLAQNGLFVVFFAGLTYAAIALRHRPDWHKRLMLCATLVVAIPGFARWIILLAPPPDSAKHLITIAVFLIPAILFDLATRRGVHPAYLAGAAAILTLERVAIPLLSGYPPFIALAARIAG